LVQVELVELEVALHLRKGEHHHLLEVILVQFLVQAVVEVQAVVNLVHLLAVLGVLVAVQVVAVQEIQHQVVQEHQVKDLQVAHQLELLNMAVVAVVVQGQ
jgi:hypothetical protein